MAAMASLGLSTTMANVMANICSVKGMGPKGTTTQADTAMMAMVKPTKTTDRVRWVASLRVFVDSMHLSFHSKESIVGVERVPEPAHCSFSG